MTALGESVEQGFEDLFAGFEPREPVQAELIELNAAEKAFLSQRMEEKRTVEEETDRMMMANQSADHHEKEAMAIEPVAERLNTTDLSPLSADQNRQIEQVLEIHTPEINPADHVTVETANDLGYEAADLKTLAPIAEKMGRPIFRDGRLISESSAIRKDNSSSLPCLPFRRCTTRAAKCSRPPDSVIFRWTT